MTTTDYDPGPVPDEPVEMPERLDLDTVLSEEQRARWSIETDADASWALRMLAGYRRAQREDEATAGEDTARVARWLDERTAARAHHLEFFTRHLEDYGRRQRALGRKSVDVPFGVIRTREAPARVTLVDLDRFWEFAEDHPELVRTKSAPNLAELAAYVKATGEVPPGCAVVDADVSVSVVTEVSS